MSLCSHPHNGAVTAPLSALPHHDGSPGYRVRPDAISLGDEVTVRVRVPHAVGEAAPSHGAYDGVWVRSTPDGEPAYVALRRGAEDGQAVWWEGELEVRNPVQRYRFLLVRGTGAQQEQHWLNASGLHTRDVPDAEDFVVSVHAPAPDWGRDGVVYQIFPDRFARSDRAAERPTPAWARPATSWDEPPVFGHPDEPLHFFGGDLDGITDHLDHIAEVGADIVYTTPLFPGESNHRYNASTFDAIDPLLGGDEALVRLVEAVHARGWRMLGDLTSNHTGDSHEWFRRALADPSSAERGFYFFDEDGDYECWQGYRTLPRLDHTDPELTRRFHAVVRRWLEPPYSLDGWRIDVANMTGRRAATDVARDVARALRATVTGVRPDGLVLAEHGHDASGDLDGDGWHGTMNYYGFSFPVWTWLRNPDRAVPSFGLPVGTARRSGPEAFGAMRAFGARFGWDAVQTSWNILSSHDSPRIRTLTGSAERHHVAAGLQFTLPGVPMIFAGDELGFEGTTGEDSRRTMPWDRAAEWDRTTLELYAALSALRREHAALRRGSLRWLAIEDDAVAWVREHPEGDVVVAAWRAGATLSVELPASPPTLVTGAHDTGARARGPAFAVWTP